jgi:hypothetical protein
MDKIIIAIMLAVIGAGAAFLFAFAFNFPFLNVYAAVMGGWVVLTFLVPAKFR